MYYNSKILKNYLLTEYGSAARMAAKTHKIKTGAEPGAFGA
jgi:hypothetical protein